jgi:excinuclease ABC subunit A
VRGGEIVGSGNVQDLMRNPRSITGKFLREPLLHPAEPLRLVKDNTPRLRLEKVALHNVKGTDVGIPVGRLVVITGVSGSGKSTVARDVLYSNLRRMLGEANGNGRFPRKGNGGSKSAEKKRGNGASVKSANGNGSRNGRGKPGDLIGCKSMRGIEHIDRVLEVDQTPIGKTPRSCPATYIGFWDAIRGIYAGTTEARIRGYTASRFSFNTAGGRCAACEGQGLRTIEMNFLPDVKVMCDVCGGRRFDRATLEVRWRDRSIGDVLAMQVDEAVEFFAATPAIAHPLSLLRDVGLGYLTLGQASPTLSGGEAQRIKLVTELARARVADPAGLPSEARSAKEGGATLYVLDEPTVGLSMADIEKLLSVIHRLVDAGHTVVIIEHNLDVIADADWIIDLGPEGGTGGGRLVAQDIPAQIARCDSPTGAALRSHLDRSNRTTARHSVDSPRLQQA